MKKKYVDWNPHHQIIKIFDDVELLTKDNSVERRCELWESLKRSIPGYVNMMDTTHPAFFEYS